MIAQWYLNSPSSLAEDLYTKSMVTEVLDKSNTIYFKSWAYGYWFGSSYKIKAARTRGAVGNFGFSKRANWDG